MRVWKKEESIKLFRHISSSPLDIYNECYKILAEMITASDLNSSWLLYVIMRKSTNSIFITWHFVSLFSTFSYQNAEFSFTLIRLMNLMTESRKKMFRLRWRKWKKFFSPHNFTLKTFLILFHPLKSLYKHTHGFYFMPEKVQF